MNRERNFGKKQKITNLFRTFARDFGKRENKNFPIIVK